MKKKKIYISVSERGTERRECGKVEKKAKENCQHILRHFMPEKKNKVVLFVNRIKIRFIRLPDRSWLSLSLYCLSYLPSLFLCPLHLFKHFSSSPLSACKIHNISSALFRCVCLSVLRHLYIACSLSPLQIVDVFFLSSVHSFLN